MPAPKPLELKRFYILLGLSKEPMHAYALQEQIMADSQSSLYCSFTSLYRLLDEMTRRGWLECDITRKWPRYKVTPVGRRLLKAEALLLKAAAMVAERRLP